MEEIVNEIIKLDGSKEMVTKCLLLVDCGYSVDKFLEENRHLEYVILKCEHHEKRKYLCDSKYGVCPGFYYKGNSDSIINKLKSNKSRIKSDMF
jgi:hypothetical protein